MRETSNIIIGKMSAIADNSLEQSRRLYYGDGVSLGIIEMSNSAATSASLAAGEIQSAATKIGSATASISDLVGIVQTQKKRNHWFSLILLNLFFASTFLLYLFSHTYQLHRVVATRNAPQIVEAFATAFGGQPLPDFDSLSASGAPISIKSYLHGIGQMPPQLALVLYSCINENRQLAQDEIHALQGQIAQLQKELERNRRVPIINIQDDSWVVRIDDQQPDKLRLKNHDGFYVRVYPAFSEPLSSKGSHEN
jgi:hypothetical protein